MRMMPKRTHENEAFKAFQPFHLQESAGG